MHVVKVGGNELDAPEFPEALALSVKNLMEPTIVVHGGGRAVSSLQRRLGIHPIKVDGLRVTDAGSLDVATMVLAGLANKQLVAAFQRAGLDAIGISGVDAGVVRAIKKPHEHDLGFVGQVAHVQTQILFHLLARGLTVVLSPISLGVDGHIYNVNADEVAAAVAIESGADALSFITNVRGVENDGIVLERIATDQVEALERTKVVAGGMVPKLRSARRAALEGVSRVRIVNLDGLRSGNGTVVFASQERRPGQRVSATS